MSIGSGHVWETVQVRDLDWADAEDKTLHSLVCVHCGAIRDGGRRPIGTCSAGTHTAQRRAAGEAEIRATLDRFE